MITITIRNSKLLLFIVMSHLGTQGTMLPYDLMYDSTLGIVQADPRSALLPGLGSYS